MESGSNSGRTSSQATASSRDRNLSNSENTVPDWLKNVSVRFAGLQMEILNSGRQEEPPILISRLLLRMRRMYVASIRLDFPIWSRAFQTSIPRYLITRVLTIWHVKPTQSPALVQKRFDVRSLSPAVHNLWLLLVWLKSVIKDANRKTNPFNIIVHRLESAFI